MKSGKKKKREKRRAENEVFRESNAKRDKNPIHQGLIRGYGREERKKQGTWGVGGRTLRQDGIKESGLM